MEALIDLFKRDKIKFITPSTGNAVTTEGRWCMTCGTYHMENK